MSERKYRTNADFDKRGTPDAPAIIEREEIEIANDLFKAHQEMVKSGKWDAELHNKTMIQLQIAWPFAYASAIGLIHRTATTDKAREA